MWSVGMEFFVNYLVGSENDFVVWVKVKEEEGWYGICVSDYFWVGEICYFYVFVIVM